MGYLDERNNLFTVLRRLQAGYYTKSDPRQREAARLLLTLQDTTRHNQLQGMVTGFLVGELGFLHFKQKESFVFRLLIVLAAREVFLYMHMPKYLQVLALIDKHDRT